ncbi:MAG TPA: M48 family metalloprotease [Steroidobacter sp.]
MDFFARQDQARRTSRRLIVLFVLAVIAVVVAVDLVVFTAISIARPDVYIGDGIPTLKQWMLAHPGTVVVVTAIVLAVIGLASLYKTMVLGGGGGVVARSLGGVRVSPDTTNPLERRLLNVVEEMSIASGVPMPEVYLLEHESGINAFAAGHTPSDAAIGVTRGALTTLNRAELQGVIAHEFSHVLNGDMRLNLRLMGLLFGLLVIALVGRTLLRESGRGRSGKRGGSGTLLLLLVALGLLVVGYVGLLFGRLIQAAVSRAREALADASAVQFTRDPLGLRGALVKIAATSGGSRIAHPEADEVAHMLFAPGMRRLFATHPPLMERLKALDPRFDPKEIEEVRARLLVASEQPAESAPREAREARANGPIELPLAAPATIAGLVGNPGTAHMRLARQIRESLPEPIVLAGRHAESARALLLAIALDQGPELRARQLESLAAQLGAPLAQAVQNLLSDVDALAPEQRMPALLRAFPALRQLTREERLRLLAFLNSLLSPDGQIALESYVLRKLTQVHLHDELEPGRKRELTLSAVRAQAQVLFSVLAQHGHADSNAARRAYEAGMHHLYPRERPVFEPVKDWAPALDRALSRLDRLLPAGKEALVEALVATIRHDERLTLGESELLRAVCASLHCPLPPLIAPKQDTT